MANRNDDIEDTKHNEDDSWPYYVQVGFKLDYKFFSTYHLSTYWCPARVLKTNSKFVIVGLLNWTTYATNSGLREMRVDRDKMETDLADYGVMTNQSIVNAKVHPNKRDKHPSKEEAEKVRQAQQKEFANKHPQIFLNSLHDLRNKCKTLERN